MLRALARFAPTVVLGLLLVPVSAFSGGPDPLAFDGQRAFAHLEALVALGPRVAGTPAGEAARDYVRGELAGLGYAVEEDPVVLTDSEAPPLASLRAVAWGASDDLIILAAPLDTPAVETFRFVGANEGASGAALLLEMARVLRERPLPYTVWLTFLDGEHVEGASHLGGRALAARLRRDGDLSRLHLFVYFHQVADRDLAIARDSGSHRAMRRIFFEAARRMGHGDAFPMERVRRVAFEGHRPLERVGFRRVVLLMDDRFGGEEAPGVYHRTAEDTPERCAQESLEVVGRVALQGLLDAVQLFQTVDARARPRAPHDAGEEPAVEPAAGDGAPEGGAEASDTAQAEDEGGERP